MHPEVKSDVETLLLNNILNSFLFESKGFPFRLNIDCPSACKLSNPV